MEKYYYLIASLISLKFGARPPITFETFMQECEKWLSSSDLKAVSTATIEYSMVAQEDTELLKAWKNFNTKLKTALMHIRLARKGNEGYKGSEELRAIFNLETPLAMERKIEEMRWAFLDEREMGFFFDANKLVIYFLKLQILRRIASFNKDEGERFFNELTKGY